jgi:ABC-type transporter Mla MlaB component
MLRITSLNRGQTLKLEGALREAWLDEVRTALADTSHPRQPVQLDLADVTFVDRAAVALLRELAAQGAQLTSCSAFVAASLGLEKP